MSRIFTEPSLNSQINLFFYLAGLGFGFFFSVYSNSPFTKTAGEKNKTQNLR